MEKIKAYIEKNRVFLVGMVAALILVLQQALQSGDTSWKAVGFSALLAIIGYIGKQRKGKGFTIAGIVITLAGVFHTILTTGVFTWNEFLLSSALALLLLAMESLSTTTTTTAAVILLTLGMASCVNQAKVQRWNAEHPAAAAESCAENFPARASIEYRDSIHFDTLYQEGGYVVDTLYLKGDTVTLSRPCPKPRIETRTILRERTVTLVDSAEAVALRSQITDQLKAAVKHSAAYAKLEAREVDAQEGRDRWRKWCLITWAAIAGYIILRAKVLA